MHGAPRRRKRRRTGNRRRRFDKSGRLAPPPSRGRPGGKEPLGLILEVNIEAEAGTVLTGSV